jgi:hypothetical protein
VVVGANEDDGNVGIGFGALAGFCVGDLDKIHGWYLGRVLRGI